MPVKKVLYSTSHLKHVKCCPVHTVHFLYLKKTSQSSVITVILSFQTATATDNSYKTDAELNKNNPTNQNEKQSE